MTENRDTGVTQSRPPANERRGRFHSEPQRADNSGRHDGDASGGLLSVDRRETNHLSGLDRAPFPFAFAKVKP